MMNDNEIKFLQYVNNSPNAYVRKFNLILKQKVLTQLSRVMLTELFENYRDTIEPKFNVKAVCMQCANSLFNIVRNIAMKYFELQAKWEEQINDEQMAIYAQEDADEENRLSELLNNDENRIALYKSRNIFNAEYVENTKEIDTEKLIEIFDEINEKDEELSIEKINEIYNENKLKNEEILLIKNHILDAINNTKNDENIGVTFETTFDSNTREITSVVNNNPVVTEEKKETFVKPKVVNKTNNTTPLLNKNKKKTNKK